MIRMKIVTQVKLMPEADQAAALGATLRTVNDLATWVSEVAFVNDVPREYELRKHTYAHLKEEGLGAQAAQHVIKKVRAGSRACASCARPTRSRCSSSTARASPT
jgi:putative transposase